MSCSVEKAVVLREDNMTLDDLVTHGTTKNPVKAVIYGQHGTGKTTFGGDAPGAILLRTEDGADAVDCAKLPLCKDFETVIKQLGLLVKEEHEYKTLVIDSLDWLELLIHEHVSKMRGKKCIGDFDYGKGYAYSTDEFMRVIKACDILRQEKSMHIIMLAHCKNEEFKCPVAGIYNRYSLDLHKSISAKIAHWADLIGFLQFKKRVISDEGQFNSEHRRVLGGERVLCFDDAPAYEAKRRLKFPGEMKLDAVKFWKQIDG